jgi:hypothetical protein
MRRNLANIEPPIPFPWWFRNDGRGPAMPDVRFSDDAAQGKTTAIGARPGAADQERVRYRPLKGFS